MGYFQVRYGDQEGLTISTNFLSTFVNLSCTHFQAFGLTFQYLLHYEASAHPHRRLEGLCHTYEELIWSTLIGWKCWAVIRIAQNHHSLKNTLKTSYRFGPRWTYIECDLLKWTEIYFATILLLASNEVYRIIVP